LTQSTRVIYESITLLYGDLRLQDLPQFAL
jgi:hypothetical protein